MPLVECPDCRKQVSDAAPACIHCGRPLARTDQIAAGGTLKDRPGARGQLSEGHDAPARVLYCPQCGSDDVRKLSIVHSGGLTHVATGTIGGGSANHHLGLGLAATFGTHTTDLARQAAPPTRPRHRSVGLRGVAGALILCVGLSLSVRSAGVNSGYGVAVGLT